MLSRLGKYREDSTGSFNLEGQPYRPFSACEILLVGNSEDRIYSKVAKIVEDLGVYNVSPSSP